MNTLTPRLSEPGHEGESYRVLFRRKMSLMRGCVKFTSPFLAMLVTRSLWSSMCRSILSVRSPLGEHAVENAFLAGWAHPQRGVLAANGATSSRRERPGVEKHPSQFDSSPAETLYIQTPRKGGGVQRDTPPPLKATGPDGKSLAREERDFRFFNFKIKVKKPNSVIIVSLGV